MFDRIEQELTSRCDAFLLRISHLMQDAETDALPLMREAIDDLCEDAVELKSYTSVTARQMVERVRGELHDAADRLSDDRRQLSDLLARDWQWIEGRLFELFDDLADPTVVELESMQVQAASTAERHTGQFGVDATYVCDQCGAQLHLHNGARIPPCPSCHATVFSRLDD